jgi:hypothetical protein
MHAPIIDPKHRVSKIGVDLFEEIVLSDARLLSGAPRRSRLLKDTR